MMNYAVKHISNYRNITEIPDGHLPKDLDPYGYEDNWAWAFANMYNLTELPFPFYNWNGAINFAGCFYDVYNVKEFPEPPESAINCASMYAYTDLDKLPKLPPNIKNARSMFARTNIQEMYDEFPETIEDMTAMFNGCSNAKGEIPKLPPKVNDLWATFNYCEKLTGNLPDVSNMINLYSAFSYCSNLTGTISNLNPNLKRLDYAFENCTNLTKLGKIDEFPKNVFTMTRAFCNCVNLEGEVPDISNLNIEYNVFHTYGVGGAFQNCYKLTGTPTLPNSEDLSMGSVYENCSNLTGSIPEIPYNASISSSFYGCSNLTGNLPDLSNKSIYRMSYAFAGCSNITGGLYNCFPDPNAHRNSVTIYGAFENCVNLQGEIPDWISNINTTNISGIFKNCRSLTGFQNINASIGYTIMASAFDNCTNLVNCPTYISGSHLFGAFRNCVNITGNFPRLHVINNRNASYRENGNIDYIFYNCRSITGSLPYNIDVNVKTMENAFANCISVSNSDVYVYSNNLSYSNIRNCFDNIPATINIYCYPNTNTYNSFADYVEYTNNIESNGPRYLYTF